MSEPHPNEQQGTFAAEKAAEEFGVTHAPEEASWYDLVDEETGAKYETKSVVPYYPSGQPGRFRLWEDQHVSLTRADASGTAWYVFVLLEETGPDSFDVDEMRRMRPSTVTRIVKEIGDGEWNLSSHQRRERQQKVPWPRVFSR